jgi:hypothetical protein
MQKKKRGFGKGWGFLLLSPTPYKRLIEMDNQTQNAILEAFAQTVGVPKESVRFSSTEKGNKTTLTLQSIKTDPEDGSTTNSQLIISNGDKPTHYHIIGKVTSPNRDSEWEKNVAVANSPQQLASLVKNMLLVQKVCRKSPKLIDRIVRRTGSYL